MREQKLQATQWLVIYQRGDEEEEISSSHLFSLYRSHCSAGLHNNVCTPTEMLWDKRPEGRKEEETAGLKETGEAEEDGQVRVHLSQVLPKLVCVRRKFSLLLFNLIPLFSIFRTHTSSSYFICCHGTPIGFPTPLYGRGKCHGNAMQLTSQKWTCEGPSL